MLILRMLQKLKIKFYKAKLPTYVRAIEQHITINTNKTGDDSVQQMLIAHQDKKGNWYIRADMFCDLETADVREKQNRQQGRVYEIEDTIYELPLMDGTTKKYKHFIPLDTHTWDNQKMSFEEMLYFITTDVRVKYFIAPQHIKKPRPNHWTRHFRENGLAHLKKNKTPILYTIPTRY